MSFMFGLSPFLSANIMLPVKFGSNWSNCSLKVVQNVENFTKKPLIFSVYLGVCDLDL